MFQAKVVEKIKKKNVRRRAINFFPRKLCNLWDNMEKNGRIRGAIDDHAIRRTHFAHAA